MSWSALTRTEAGAPQSASPRVLVGGVGYRNLSDLSAGPLLVDAIGELGSDVEVDDLSYGPIDVLFKLQASDPYAKLVIIGAASRGDPPGTVRREVWQRQRVEPETLQGRIAEAVTGVISHENLLYILDHFGVLPPSTVVIEIEPEVASFGEGPTATGARAIARAAELVRAEVAAIE